MPNMDKNEGDTESVKDSDAAPPKKAKKSHEENSEYICQNAPIVEYDGQLYYWNESQNEFSVLDKDGEMTVISQFMSGTTINQRREIAAFFKKYAIKLQPEPYYIIRFKNGYVDVSPKEKEEDTNTSLTLIDSNLKDHFFPNTIPINYENIIHCETVDKYLDTITDGDMNLRTVIEEVLGYCFCRKNFLQKAIWFQGAAGTGKSTLCKVFEKLLGPENRVNISVSEYGNTFQIARMKGKLLVTDSDVRQIQRMDEAIAEIFKKVPTGDTLSAGRKHKDAEDFEPYCTPIYFSNFTPNILTRKAKGTSSESDFDAFQRRLMGIPLNHVFSESEKDIDMESKITTPQALQYWALLGMKGLQRLLKHKKFTSCDAVKHLTQGYAESPEAVTPFMEWQNYCAENNRVLPDCLAGKTMDNVYQFFCDFTEIKKIPNPYERLEEFSKEFRAAYSDKLMPADESRKTIDGKKCAVVMLSS